jgi:hypothetical protein
MHIFPISIAENLEVRSAVLLVSDPRLYQYRDLEHVLVSRNGEETNEVGGCKS